MSAPPVTRRSVVGGALGALGWWMAGRPALGANRAQASGSPISTLWLAGRRWRSEPDGTVRSEPIATDGRFDMVGVEWDAPAGAHIELRVNGDAGWSAWVPGDASGHGPDRARRSHAGDPVWCRGASVIQLRASHELTGARLHLVASEGAAAAALDRARERLALVASLPLLARRLDAGPGQPPILARRAWAGRAERPRGEPAYGRIKLVFVHHTENASAYARHEVPALLRAICHYHRDALGWHDIGYNFLVDRYGRLWEGRAGGAHEAVLGAQAGGYNPVSSGIAVLGNFQSQPPTHRAVRALSRLLAWKLALHGLPSHGHVRVRVDPSGAHYTPFRGGAHVSLPRIAGHRDGDSTNCPGDSLYRRLPGVRRSAQRLARGRISHLAVEPPTAAGAYLHASCRGRLTQRDGDPVVGARVQVEVRGSHAPPVGHAVSAADGRWATELALPHSAEIRAVFAGGAAHAAAVSDGVVVTVGARVALAAALVPATLAVAVTGRVEPAKAAVRLELYLAASGHRLLSRRRVPTTKGRFSTTILLPASGSYRIIARSPADEQNAPGVSPPVDITVPAPPR